MVFEAAGHRENMAHPRSQPASGQDLNWGLSDSKTHRSHFHSGRCSPLGFIQSVCWAGRRWCQKLLEMNLGTTEKLPAWATHPTATTYPGR